MNFRFLIWSVGLTFVFILSACGENATPTPPAPPTHPPTPTRPAVVLPTAAPGWKIFKRSTYQLTLPDGWQEIKLQADEIKNAVAAAQANNPPLADTLRALLEAEQYKEFIFYAADQNAAPQPRTISIARAALPPNQNIAGVASAYAETLPQLVRGAQLTRTRAPFQRNGMNVAAFDYTLAFVDDRAKLVTLRGTQYLYVSASGDAYLVTVTGDAADAAFDDIVRGIAETFVILPP